MVCELGFDNVTVNTAAMLPSSGSVTLTSLMLMVGSPSSSVIVPVPEVVPPGIVAPLDAFDNVTVNVSSVSSIKSPITYTVMVLDVSPGANVSVPLVYLQSSAEVACPSDVA